MIEDFLVQLALDDDAEHADVFANRMAHEHIKNAGTGMKAPLACVTAQRPLRPTDRNPENEERNEIGEHERAAAVLGGQAGKAQKISETDSAAGHGENHAQARAPHLGRLSVGHDPVVLRGAHETGELEFYATPVLSVESRCKRTIAIVSLQKEESAPRLQTRFASNGDR